jgi:hypothetical protein
MDGLRRFHGAFGRAPYTIGAICIFKRHGYISGKYN